MGKVPEIVPISDLRQDAAGILQRIRDTNQPFVITQRGRAAAVLISVEAFDRAEYERDLLLALVRGDREITARKGHNLDDVLAEADRLLTAHRK